ncbi:MAG: ASKHA domain-containing protein [Synergistaceae bacterium]|nr:ASKHA domain-containing protein [Synergistaceae bacterium]
MTRTGRGRALATVEVTDGLKKATVSAKAGDIASDAIKRAGMHLPMPCGGRGLCGKCSVWVCGDFDQISDAEAAMLGRAKPAGAKPADGCTLRMACMCRVGDGGGEIAIPGGGNVSVVDAASSDLVYDGGGGACGVAVDIGTTTISALLFDFETGRLAAAAHEINRQTAYGADVLSRIDHSNRNGPRELHECIVGQLDGMISRLVCDSGLAARKIERVVIAGNTTMLHFMTGLDPRGIGVAPFEPQSLFGEEMDAGEFFPARAKGAELYIPPSISAYVGADVTCGILSTGLDAGDTCRLLIDVGTNGEMALRSSSRILCCATAAGPAFEGASIAMGMPAMSGAISSVFERAGEVGYATINGAPPTGICGSGMISAICSMRCLGVLDESGKMLAPRSDLAHLLIDAGKEKAFMLGDSGVYLTQRDIRNIQLVKASIAAGVQVLLKAAGVSASGVESLYLSGGFGSTLDPGEASGIGLFPSAMLGRTVASGNTSLSGAIRLLFSRAARRKTSEITAMAREISLSESAEFMEEYVENMIFPSDF